MSIRRTAATAAATIALSVAGATSAQAWQWAPYSNPIQMNGGKGYGATKPSGLYEATLISTLADTKTGDGRIYAKTAGTMSGASVVITSGRRADGGSSFARMSDVTSGTGSRTVYQYSTWTTQLCRDVPLQIDPCSDDIRSTRGPLS